jgi:hypothetical protein
LATRRGSRHDDHAIGVELRLPCCNIRGEAITVAQ